MSRPQTLRQRTALRTLPDLETRQIAAERRRQYVHDFMRLSAPERPGLGRRLLEWADLRGGPFTVGVMLGTLAGVWAPTLIWWVLG